ncbi:MAG: hypothetical protein KA142_01385 [Chromatiaceae bacterium]|nr:hypothetical protein [Chromatiaceae bacterium]
MDGKTARGSQDRWRGRRPLPRVSAWACRHRWVLGQEATEEKSNEITVIPKLLELPVADDPKPAIPRVSSVCPPGYYRNGAYCVQNVGK